MTGYGDLLERGMKKLPGESGDGERFSVPQAEVLIQGARTIFLNFYDVAGALRRDPKHLLKFFTKELATSYEESGKKVIFQGRFPGSLMNRKVDIYVKNYVLCPNCLKPDTKLVKVDRIEFIKCEACGSRQAVKKVR